MRRTDKPGNNDFVYELGETWVYTCSTTVLTNRVSQYATAGGNHSADGGARWASAASSVRRTVATDHSAGTVSFTFSMSNLSQNNLSSPSPSDTQCDPLLRMEDDPGNNDNVFEPDETWVYTCSNPLTAPVDQGSSGSVEGSGQSGSAGSSGSGEGSGQSGSAPGYGQSGSTGSSGTGYGQSGSTGSSGTGYGQSSSTGSSGTGYGQSGSTGSSGTDYGQSGSTGSSGTGSSGNSPQVTEAPDSQNSWWARYLEETEAAASGSQEEQATDEVQPEFTAWTWGHEDALEGELQPPGSSDSSAGYGPSATASGNTEEPKLSWWQRYLLKKRGR